MSFHLGHLSLALSLPSMGSKLPFCEYIRQPVRNRGCQLPPGRTKACHARGFGSRSSSVQSQIDVRLPQQAPCCSLRETLNQRHSCTAPQLPIHRNCKILDPCFMSLSLGQFVTQQWVTSALCFTTNNTRTHPHLHPEDQFKCNGQS
jgi:hypothetical protein